MTALIWMASPPEVHSALLSGGPGPGALLAAADTWNSLSAEYTSAAAELSAVLASVQGGSWAGPTAQSYVAAHLPYLQWLTAAGAQSAAAAAQHQAAAAAHTAALAAMPTLVELAANHAVHAVLTATNFFGINAIPITLNETDYARMWVQAATTMAAYQAASEAAVASTPHSDPAPQILKSEALNPLQQIEQIPQQIFQLVLRLIGISWDPANGTLNGIPYASYTVPGQPGYWISRLFLFAQDFQGLQQWIQLLMTNPIAALQSLGGITPAQALAYLLVHPVLAAAIATSPLWSALATLPAAAASVAALAALAALPAAAPAVAALGPVAALAPIAAAAPAAFAPALAGSTPPGVPSAAPATTVSTVSPTPPSPTPPPGHGFVPYAVAGGPGVGFGPVHRSSVGARARAKAPEPDSAAVAAATAARRAARRRRQQGEPERHHADEFADMPSGSDSGAGPLGFTGTMAREQVRPAGLITLAGDAFGGGPTIPMVPTTWDTDGPDET